MIMVGFRSIDDLILTFLANVANPESLETETFHQPSILELGSCREPHIVGPCFVSGLLDHEFPTLWRRGTVQDVWFLRGDQIRDEIPDGIPDVEVDERIWRLGRESCID